jgi:hypothetical protein
VGVIASTYGCAYSYYNSVVHKCLWETASGETGHISSKFLLLKYKSQLGGRVIGFKVEKSDFTALKKYINLNSDKQKGEKMFRSLRKKFAKIALSVMVIQLSLLGVTAVPNTASAAVDPFGGQVTGFTLYNSDTDAVIKSLESGTVINMADSEIGNKLNIVAETLPALVGSVKLELSGAENFIQKENVAPYALKGDTNSNYNNWTPTVGTYVLKATPYELSNYGGQVGIDHTITFTVYDDGIAPIVTTSLVGDYSITDTTVLNESPVEVELTYNEPMDVKSVPVLEFSQDIASTVTCTGSWMDVYKHKFTCELSDNEIELTGITTTVSGAKDLAGNIQVEFVPAATLNIDTKGPQISVTNKPVVVTDLNKDLEVTFNSLSKFKLSNLNYSLNGVFYAPQPGVTVTPSVDSDLFELKHILTIPAGYFQSTDVINKISIAYVATDEMGNSTSAASYEIKVDTVAPLAVTGLKADVAESGVVTLSWINPVNNTDIDYIEVRRDGVFVSTLPATSSTFVDSSTEKGKTYYYEIVLVDKAGNKTVTPRLDVVVPAPVVAAAVSDSVAVTPATSTQDSGEVKAETAEDKSNEENKEEEKSEFPVWGIVLLLVLLAVGGYLYWSQKPATIASVAPKAAPVKKAKSKTKKK